MIKANDRQIGGDHYKVKYEHWDFAIGTNTPYILACVSKYVSRYPEKNGLQDLEKAMHYLDKCIETNCICPTLYGENLGRLDKFATQFNDIQETIIRALYRDDSYTSAKRLLAILISTIKETKEPYTRG